MKILFITPILGYPPIGGSELRIVNFIKALSKISDLHIINIFFSSPNLSVKTHQHYKKIFGNYFF